MNANKYQALNICDVTFLTIVPNKGPTLLGGKAGPAPLHVWAILVQSLLLWELSVSSGKEVLSNVWILVYNQW